MALESLLYYVDLEHETRLSTSISYLPHLHHTTTRDRRESCRDGGFSRPCDHGLSAEKLLGDAQDVARIRSDGGLRASFQGVCWIASNCCVGDKKSLLSGRRYLVLCDKIVWAELCEAGGRDSVTSRASVEEDGGKQG